MKTLMSYDGLNEVDVPIDEAIDKATKQGDEYNLLQLTRIKQEIVRMNRITRANLDYVEEYVMEH